MINFEDLDNKQQGDVLLYDIDTLPEIITVVPPKANGIILAEGSATGHAHRIADVNAAQLFTDNDGQLFLTVKYPTVLIHEEHENHTLEVGNYAVGFAQEYDHFAEEARRVLD